MCETKFAEKVKTQILCSVTLPPPENVLKYKNIVEMDRTKDNNIVRRMRIVCYISDSANTHSECVMLNLKEGIKKCPNAIKQIG